MRAWRVMVLAMVMITIVGCESTVEVFGLSIAADIPTTTPAPTATSTTAPTRAPTSLPTWTPDFDVVPPTPYPIPTAAAFPGDMTLTLSYELLPDQPNTVRFTSVIAGGPDNSFELYCMKQTFYFGEDSVTVMMPDCIAWTPDYRFARVTSYDHTYQRSGTYQVRFIYEGASPDGTHLGVDRALTSNVLTVNIP